MKNNQTMSGIAIDSVTDGFVISGLEQGYFACGQEFIGQLFAMSQEGRLFPFYVHSAEWKPADGVYCVGIAKRTDVSKL